MNRDVFLKCKNKEFLYFTTDEAEIKEAMEQEVIRSLKMCWKTLKERLLPKGAQAVYDYVERVDPFDVSYSEMAEGFLRTPKTQQEMAESEWYCLAEPAEPMELEEADDGCGCSD